MTLRSIVPAALIVGVVVASGPLACAGTGAVKGTITSEVLPGSGVVNAVVMIEGPSLPAAANAPHAVIDQRRTTFSPHVLAVPVGTTVDFPNRDPTLHNVFSASPAKRFDLGMYDEGQTKSVTFDTPGVVEIDCNVHSKMQGFVVVHANPYLAVTDAHGSYSITGVPPGAYQARVWHEQLGTTEVPVTVREGQVQPLDVRLERAR